MLEERQWEFRAVLEGVVAWSEVQQRAGMTRKGEAAKQSGPEKPNQTKQVNAELLHY